MLKTLHKRVIEYINDPNFDKTVTVGLHYTDGELSIFIAIGDDEFSIETAEGTLEVDLDALLDEEIGPFLEELE